ncbi:MAG: ABC transporter substrate-binding protein [Deferribacteres bacterium]|nr:ABC transporter substrate-binding protein [Deferribacteres bacterium]
MRQAVRIFAGMVAAAVIMSAGYVFSMSGKPEVKPTVKIGFSIPLTGDIGFIGEGMRDAAILAKEEMGETKYNYELLFEDDKLDPKIDATVGNKFISIDKVDVIVSAGGGSGGVLSRLADQHGIIHFAVTTEPSVTKGENNFAHWTSLPEQNSVMAEQIRKRGYTRPAAFVNVSLNDYVSIYNDLKTRVDFVGTQEVQSGQKDFRTEIARIKQARPDIIVLILRTPELEILTKQIKELGLDVPLTAIESFAVSKEPELFEGEFFVGGAEPSHGFIEAFRKRFGKDQTIGAANAYDIVKLVITAAENVKSSSRPTPDQISAELKKIRNFKGALGTLYVKPNGRVYSRPTVQMIKNGKVVHIEP